MPEVAVTTIEAVLRFSCPLLLPPQPVETSSDPAISVPVKHASSREHSPRRDLPAPTKKNPNRHIPASLVVVPLTRAAGFSETEVVTVMMLVTAPVPRVTVDGLSVLLLGA